MGATGADEDCGAGKEAARAAAIDVAAMIYDESKSNLAEFSWLVSYGFLCSDKENFDEPEVDA